MHSQREHSRESNEAQLASANPSDSGEFPTAMAAAGEASSKLLRFICFVGAGVICTKAINTYRDYEHKQEASAAATAAAEAAAAVVAVDPAPASAAAAAKP